MTKWTRWPLLLACLVLLFSSVARAEYRAYELEVVDVVDCRLNKRKVCRSAITRSSMPPDVYARTHGGKRRISVVMLATWMCYGDTSGLRPVCAKPAPHNAKFAVGDRVRILLPKHITEGWEGQIEVAYYQRSVQSNVYGVRFADRQNVYARYFEKDIARQGEGAPQSEPPR